MFQRVVDGSNLFIALVGKKYRGFIGNVGVTKMVMLVNRRHLAPRNNSIVHDGYLRKTTDRAHGIDQRIIVKDSVLLTSLGLIENIVEGLLAVETQPSTG